MDTLGVLFEAENLALIRRHQLFNNLDNTELIAFFRTVNPEFLELEPNGRVTVESGTRRRLGIVIEGDVKVLIIDYSGNKTILNTLQNHGFIGTMQFMADYYNVLFEVVSDSHSKIILISLDDLLTAIEGIELIQHKILVNLLIAQRQLFILISEHLVCLSQKNIRDKVLRYLQIQSEHAHSYEFEVSLSREDMASYLAVDRASLSRSLGELKRDGIIEFKKNRFKILSTRYFIY